MYRYYPRGIFVLIDVCGFISVVCVENELFNLITCSSIVARVVRLASLLLYIFVFTFHLHIYIYVCTLPIYYLYTTYCEVLIHYYKYLINIDYIGQWVWLHVSRWVWLPCKPVGVVTCKPVGVVTM